MLRNLIRKDSVNILSSSFLNVSNKTKVKNKINSISFFPKHKIDKDDGSIETMIKRQDNFSLIEN